MQDWTSKENVGSLLLRLTKSKTKVALPKHSDALLCTGCGTRTELSIKESMKFSYSDIQNATNDFSKDNLLGEGGYGHVYKGVLKDGYAEIRQGNWIL